MATVKTPTRPDYEQADRKRPVVEPATEARQGVTGHNVRNVLAFGTIGVIVLFVLVYFFFFA